MNVVSAVTLLSMSLPMATHMCRMAFDNQVVDVRHCDDAVESTADHHASGHMTGTHGTAHQGSAAEASGPVETAYVVSESSRHAVAGLDGTRADCSMTADYTGCCNADHNNDAVASARNEVPQPSLFAVVSSGLTNLDKPVSHRSAVIGSKFEVTHPPQPSLHILLSRILT
ncbi:MAG: hypothetical protein KDD65_15715 [Bacteroidetes bacterium]|nr:hypothetical protein [Bacteroidota bacterium]